MKTPHIQTLNDFVVVKPYQKPSHNELGLQTSITTDTSPDQGVVLSVGPGKHDAGVFVPTTVKVGDHILFAPNSGAYVKLGDDIDKLLILVESNIIGIMNPPA